MAESLTPDPSPTAEGEGRTDAYPVMMRVGWLRGERLQMSVGFLVAENANHMVMVDTYDGKHPNSRRLWTIYHVDVQSREEIRCG